MDGELSAGKTQNGQRCACVLSEEYAAKCSITSTQKSVDKRQGNRKPMQTLWAWARARVGARARKQKGWVCASASLLHIGTIRHMSITHNTHPHTPCKHTTHNNNKTPQKHNIIQTQHQTSNPNTNNSRHNTTHTHTRKGERQQLVQCDKNKHPWWWWDGMGWGGMGWVDRCKATKRRAKKEKRKISKHLLPSSPLLLSTRREESRAHKIHNPWIGAKQGRHTSPSPHSHARPIEQKKRVA